MNKIDNLEDTECLYRWILSNTYNNKTPPHYTRDPSTGDIDIHSEAFLGGKRPSVDIASINCYKPKKTKSSNTDGVVGFTVKDVKSIEIRGGRIPSVCHEPLPENKAHAEIKLDTDDDNVNKGALSDLRRGLAKRSVVKLEPIE
jgi:hypothetical protein